MDTDKILYIKKRKAIIAARLESIVYLEKCKRQIIVHLIEGEEIWFYGKFDAVMPMLDERFAHPHQSYIINMQHIRRLGKNEAVMFGGNRIRMGKHCFTRLRKAYDEYINDNIRDWPDYNR